jgi:hypothetical protein
MDLAPVRETVSHTGVLALFVTKLQLKGLVVPFSKPGLAIKFPEPVTTSLNEKPPCAASMGSMVPFIDIPSIVPFSPRLSFKPSPLEIIDDMGIDPFKFWLRPGSMAAAETRIVRMTNRNEPDLLIENMLERKEWFEGI